MKKNAMLKIAAILMVAVLLTTCAISSTFAKYITTGEGVASARVAKWGVEVTVDADEAFYTNYHTGTNDIVVAGTKVVAPGTQSLNAIVITVKGTPEVDATIDFGDSNFLQLGNNWKSGGVDYCPLIFKVGTENYYIGKTGIASVNELQEAVNDAIKDALDEEFVANVETNISIKVGWTWNFEQPTDLTGLTGFTQDNDKDSDLGDIAATDTANAPTVSFDATITVAQTGSNFATNGAYVAPADPEGE